MAVGNILPVSSPNSNCTISFADGSPAIQFSSSRARTYMPGDFTSDDTKPVVAKQGFFPWWQSDPNESLNSSDAQVACYHSSVRLNRGREGLVIDTGAVKSLSGDAWVQRTKAIGELHGHGTNIVALERPFGIEGVGNGSNQVTQQAVVPIALSNGFVGTFKTSMVSTSEIPALYGLEPMIEQKTILDLHNGKMILLGEGGYELKLSPGSVVLDLERAPTGHIMLPITEWPEYEKRTKPGPTVNSGKKHVALVTL